LRHSRGPDATAEFADIDRAIKRNFGAAQQVLERDVAADLARTRPGKT
jgi:hypothetical protein